MWLVWLVFFEWVFVLFGLLDGGEIRILGLVGLVGCVCLKGKFIFKY